MKLAYTEQGEHSTLPLVLIHAFPVTRRMWRRQWEGLSHTIRVFAPDLPGFGESPLLEKSPSVASYVETMVEFLDGLSIQRAVFGGCSMGGYFIFDLWRRHPHRVAGIILCDTRAEDDTPELREKRMKSIEQVRSQGLAPLAEGMLPLLLCRETHEQRKEKVEEIRTDILGNTPQGIIHCLTALASRPDSRNTLKTISVPTLIVVGKDDVITPPTIAQSLQAGIPNSTLAVIPSAGHLSPFEQPEEVNAAISKFIGSAGLIK